LYQEESGLSLGDGMRRYRLRYAENLLLTGQLTVVDIARR
jgi:AraC-like DNA-binding protein